jgi:hypothetical protein
MGQRKASPLSTSLAILSFLAMSTQAGRVHAQSSTTEAAKPADDAEKPAPAPAAPESDKAPAAAPEASTQPAAAAPAPVQAPPPATPPVEWKAQSKGGMLITTGNAQSKNFTFGVNASRKEGNNKLTLEGGLSYGKSSLAVATPNADAAEPNTVMLDRQEVVSTNNMAAKGRYDRFLTEHNTTYVSGQAAADKIAGKTFFGGGQIGYSRLLVKDQWNLAVAELGYDFSYERYVQPGNGTTLDPVAIHSARVLVGETLSLTKETGVTASVEALFNLNKEGKALSVKDRKEGVSPFKDTRVNAKLGLSTNLWSSLSFGFSFTLKYDQNPAPRPLPKGTPDTDSWRNADFFAEKVDTFTEATLIYTFF